MAYWLDDVVFVDQVSAGAGVESLLLILMFISFLVVVF